MTKFLVCLVTAVWCLSASAQSRKIKSVTVESEIAALEQSWATAQKANDPSTIAQQFAETDPSALRCFYFHHDFAK